MKGISPIITTVIVISITITMISLVLTIANPAINRGRDTRTISDAVKNMRVIDDTIKQVASEGTGALRTLTIQSDGGTYVVRNSSGVEYTFQSDFNSVPVRSVITDENLRISSGISALGLVGYWKFDEGGGNVANDNSGKMHNAQVYVYNASLANWTNGKFGSALQFDGVNDYVTANFTLPTSAFTITAWINPKNVSGNEYVIGLGGDQTATMYLYNNVTT